MFSMNRAPPINRHFSSANTKKQTKKNKTEVEDYKMLEDSGQFFSESRPERFGLKM